MDDAMPFILGYALMAGLVLGLTMLSQSRHVAHVRAWVRWTWRATAVLSSTGLVLMLLASMFGDNIRGLFAVCHTSYYYEDVPRPVPTRLEQVLEQARALGRALGQDVEQAVEPLLPHWQQQIEPTPPAAPAVKAPARKQRPNDQTYGPSCRLQPRFLAKGQPSIAQA